MHELSLMADLMRKIEAAAQKHGASKVVGVKVQLGALAPLSAEHFREHFEWAARGTLAEGARLEIEALSDISDPHAQAIWLVSVDVEAL